MAAQSLFWNWRCFSGTWLWKETENVRKQSGTAGNVVFLYTHCIIGRTGRRGGTVPTSVFCLCTLWLHYSINAIMDDCVQLHFSRVKLLKYARSSFIFLLVDRTLGYEQEKMVRIIPRRLWPMLIIIIIIIIIIIYSGKNGGGVRRITITMNITVQRYNYKHNNNRNRNVEAAVPWNEMKWDGLCASHSWAVRTTDCYNRCERKGAL